MLTEMSAFAEHNCAKTKQGRQGWRGTTVRGTFHGGERAMIDRTMPHFALVWLGSLKPYGKWFTLQQPDGQIVRARKLLPETVTVYGYAGLNEQGRMEFEPAIEPLDMDILAVVDTFIRSCNAESDPFLFALANAMQPLNPDEAPLRWLEVNPVDGSFVVHSLLVEVEGGERIILAAHQVVWEEG
jgi:hypothetical protein